MNNALVRTNHPDNESARDDNPIQSRRQRVGSLTEELRQRFLISTLNQQVADKAAMAMVEILDGDDKRLKVELLKEILKQIPAPSATAGVSQGGGPIVAIQVNQGLKRGRKEFA